LITGEGGFKICHAPIPKMCHPCRYNYFYTCIAAFKSVVQGPIISPVCGIIGPQPVAVLYALFFVSLNDCRYLIAFRFK